MKRNTTYWGETYARFKIELSLIRTYWKSVLFILFVLIYLSSVLFRNLAYYRAVQGETLKDLGFEVLPELNSSMKAFSEIVIYMNHFVAAITLTVLPIFTKRPHENGIATIAMLLRMAFVLVIGHFLRFVTYITTSLPGPAEHCRLGSEEFEQNRPAEPLEILFRFSSAADLNCGDLVFSGHMFQVIIFTCTIWHFSDRVFYTTLHAWIAKLLMLATVVAQFFLIIASRNHYTVDVVVSSYTAPMLWICFDRYYKDIPLPTNRVGENEEEITSKDGTANESFDEETGKVISQTTSVEE